MYHHMIAFICNELYLFVIKGLYFTKNTSIGIIIMIRTGGILVIFLFRT